MRNEFDFLRDVIDRLEQVGVRYLLTGSMAANCWGTPRTTHDLDFLLDLRHGDVDRFVDAFDGMFVQRESIRAAFRPPHQFNVVDGQSELKADFWLLAADPFDLIRFSRGRSLSIANQTLRVSAPEDVILSKLCWYRRHPAEQQLVDVAGVYAVQSTALDLDYIERWSEKLGVKELWDNVRSGQIRPKST
jgi:hypothetical protein